MRSRYNLMQSSVEYDSEDLDTYPDPLTIDYDLFTLTEAPYQYEVDDLFIEKPYIITNSLYGETALDDIILDLNDVGHIQQLSSETDTVLLLPVSADLLSFYSDNQVR